MNGLLHNLEESLREELKCYGELLALLEMRPKKSARSLADELLATLSQIDALSEAIQAVRNERAQRQGEVARALGLEANLSISKLLPALPPYHQPLVGELLEENNQLLGRIRELVRRNHLLLWRALGLTERFIRSLSATGLALYNESGANLQPVVGHPP
jgi:hypothetical protein